MKHLSRAEMKKVMGGYAQPDITCNTACSHRDGNTVYVGSCSKESMTIGGVTTQYCKCSVPAGSGCNS